MRHRLISFSLLAVCSFALLTASNGCSGSGSPDAGKSEVSGTVTIDGATPPVGTTISFDSKDGKLAGDTKPVDSGKYSIRVVAGAYKVSIRAPKDSKTKDGKPSMNAEWFAEMLPDKFNNKTELTIDVASGKNEKNWDLKTK